ncbi:Bor family protein [Psychrobacter sp. NG254]|uniref:Bor family protein n=1 Tax=Psychrobacter sp. NG254 TaxID=2782003 RepID=UPI001887987D|nr:Bor family protein [Psychrobacter sp. NG254]MBF2718892.1 Bor family protein [Psychrobacter sp. NG254]
MNKIVAVALLAILTSGCATQNYLVSSLEAPNAAVKPSAEKMQTFFVSGLGQEQEIDAAKVCQGQQNVASIQTKANFINVVLGVVSNGIYTPRQISVYCK